MGNARQFSADLARFADRVDLAPARFRARVTLDIKATIEAMAPVDTGRFRGSWAVSDGAPSSFVPPPGDTTSLGPVEASFSDPFEVSFVTSNLPYTMAIEFGHSGQAPKGVARVSMAEVITKLETKFGEL